MLCRIVTQKLVGLLEGLLLFGHAPVRHDLLDPSREEEAFAPAGADRKALPNRWAPIFRPLCPGRQGSPDDLHFRHAVPVQRWISGDAAPSPRTCGRPAASTASPSLVSISSTRPCQFFGYSMTEIWKRAAMNCGSTSPFGMMA